MRYINRPPRGQRLVGFHKSVTTAGLVLIFVGYWYFAFRLEQIDYSVTAPAIILSVRRILELFGPLSRILISLFNFFAEFFNPRVLRHLFAPVVGFLLARRAILGLVQSFYDLPDSESAATLLQRLSTTRLGFVRPIPITLDNFEQVRQREPLLRIGGPGRIAIIGGAALVTEKNGRFHRVLGPGRHDLERFEFARTLVDLRPQEREAENVKMMTSDGIELTTSLTVTFQILRGDERPTKQKPFPFDREAVRLAVYSETNMADGSFGSWESLPVIITGGQLRTIVAEDRLDDLIVTEANGIDVHRRLQMEMERRAKNIMRGYGVMIRGTRLGALVLPKNVEEQRKKYWQSHWDTQRTLQKADGEAEVLQNYENARAEAEAIMLRAIAEGLQRSSRAGRGVSSREVVALRLIESLEAMAKNSEQVLTLPEQLIPQLGSLRQQLQLTAGTKEEPAAEE